MKRLIYRVRDVLLTVVILLFVGLVAVRLDDGNRQHLSGRPHVIDGDTLSLGDRRIRLSGIDAPELRQICQRANGEWPCGTQARANLIRLIGDARPTCSGNAEDRYGRLLAVCTVGGGVDLNREMVASGFAVAFGDYEKEEDDAMRRRIGLWGGTFDKPQIWRRTHGGMEEASHIGSSWPMRDVVDLGRRLLEIVSGR